MPAVWCDTDPGGERGETAQSDKIMNEMYFSKVGFEAVMVINCTVGMDLKSQKIGVLVTAAEKYLLLQHLIEYFFYNKIKLDNSLSFQLGTNES